MTCREFNQKAAALSLAELAAQRDEQMLTHGRECSACASWMREHQSLAGALESLRSNTATVEAGANVEQAVLRAFRHKVQPAAIPAIRESQSQPFAFHLSRFFEFGAYAAVAAAIVICLGVGIWVWEHAGQNSNQTASAPASSSEQTAAPRVAQSQTAAEKPSRLAVARMTARPASSAKSTVRQPDANEQDLTQLAQAQGYVPLMLCDPLSCSGDEQVVRMELPASAVDASRDSSQPLVADVVVGDDGLVRAIRIVQ